MKITDIGANAIYGRIVMMCFLSFYCADISGEFLNFVRGIVIKKLN